MKVPISKPLLGESEIQAAVEVLQSGQLIMAERVRAFERQLAAYQGVQHAVATSNGTTALIAALLAHEIGPGDEVVLPAFTFFATASAVVSVGARVAFADIDPQTYTLCPDSVERAISPKTRAVIAVHLYGQLAAMPRITELCAQRGLALIEDAAQAQGASLVDTAQPSKAGSWGSACLSFHPSKNMTTMEGGAVLTNDASIAERLRRIRNQGRDELGQHLMLGSNYRMTELSAAIGLEQLKRLPEFEQRRIRNAQYLNEHLVGVETPFVRSGYHHVYQQYTIRCTARDRLQQALREAGVDARVYYAQPLHRQPALSAHCHTPFTLTETDRACQELLSLPVHPSMTEADLELVADTVRRSVSRHTRN